MKFVSLLDSFIADTFRGTEAEQAVEEFKRRIPGRIIGMEFDPSHTNKQGVKLENKVYKLGIDVATNRVYIEYLDDPNQAQPSMTLTVDKNMPAIVINGWQVDRKMQIAFTVTDGQVHKSVKLN